MTIKRYDLGLIPTVVKKDDGSIQGVAVVTRTGVFSYRNADGSVRRELRLPEEVFKAESLDSLKMLPITNNHPAEFITPANAKDLQIGFTGERIDHDDTNVYASLVINTTEGLQEIDNGKRQFSLGYTLDVEERSGVFNGEEYDAIQRNIKYNHLALVQNARAGAVASLNMDSKDAFLDIQTTNHKKKGRNMKTINLDGIEYEAAPEVVNAYTKAEKARIDSEEKIRELQKVKDEATAERDSMKEKIEKLENVDHSDEIEKRVAERVKLVDLCREHIDDEDAIEKMSDRELKEKVISKVSEINLDDKSDDYVSARFDSAIESLREGRKKANADKFKHTNNDGANNDKPNVDDAYQRYIDGLKKAREDSFAKK